ncbi:MAG TPA: flagellar motor switch protein FliG, partial [Turneriella sp.]|nr:flagellar motor switch protein FliG [Turneriella sp.]
MSTGAKTEYSGKQKAAIFLLTVGPEVAADIMKRLSEAEVDTLTY